MTYTISDIFQQSRGILLTLGDTDGNRFRVSLDRSKVQLEEFLNISLDEGKEIVVKSDKSRAVIVGDPNLLIIPWSS